MNTFIETDKYKVICFENGPKIDGRIWHTCHLDIISNACHVAYTWHFLQSGQYKNSGYLANILLLFQLNTAVALYRNKVLAYSSVE